MHSIENKGAPPAFHIIRMFNVWAHLNATIWHHYECAFLNLHICNNNNKIGQRNRNRNLISIRKKKTIHVSIRLGSIRGLMFASIIINQLNLWIEALQSTMAIFPNDDNNTFSIWQNLSSEFELTTNSTGVHLITSIRYANAVCIAPRYVGYTSIPSNQNILWADILYVNHRWSIMSIIHSYAKCVSVKTEIYSI